MLTIGLAEAQERLGSLIELAEAGEIVCIMRRGKQVAQITGIEPFLALSPAGLPKGAVDNPQHV